MEKQQKALDVITEAVEKYKLDAVYALVSGGQDSLAAVAVASKHPKFGGVIHAETRTGPISNKVTKFVELVCKAQGWHLIKRHPATSYLMLIAEHGYPGPQSHQFAYRYLKERPFAASKIEAGGRHKQKTKTGKDKPGRIGFVTGMRRAESQKRASTPPHSKDKQGYWIAALYDWSKDDCAEMLKDANLPLNPISAALGFSGECGCGSHAAPSEDKLMGLLFAEQKIWFEKTQKVVAAARELQEYEVSIGIRDPKDVIEEYQTRWGHGRKKEQHLRIPEGQMMLPNFLCAGCIGDLDENGNVGEDPDIMMRIAQLEREQLKTA